MPSINPESFGLIGPSILAAIGVKARDLPPLSKPIPEPVALIRSQAARAVINPAPVSEWYLFLTLFRLRVFTKEESECNGSDL